MACVHLRRLYQLCQEEDLRLGGTDLIRIVCKQCGEQEVCPSTLVEDFDDEESNGEKAVPQEEESKS